MKMSRLLVLCIACMLLSGCVNGASIDANKLSSMAIDNITKSEEVDKGWKINNVYLEAASKYNKPTSASAYYFQKDSNSIYYAVTEDETMSNDCFHYRIMKKSINDNKLETLYSYDSERISRYVSVMAVIRNYVYWVEEGMADWNVIEFDTNTKAHKIIDSSEINKSNISPNLSVKGSNMFWFRSRESKNKTQPEVNLVKYEVEQKKLIEINIENLYMPSPYTGLAGSEEYITYLTKVNNEIWVNRMELKSNKTLQLNTHEPDIVYVNANKKYILWSTKWNKSILNIVDIDKEKHYSCDLKKSGDEFRSCAFYKDDIILDYSVSGNKDSKNNRLPAIYRFSPEKGEMTPVYIAKSDGNKIENFSWVNSKGNLVYTGGWISNGKNTEWELLLLTKIDNK